MGLDLKHLQGKIALHKVKLARKGEHIELWILGFEVSEAARFYYARLPRAISAEARFSAR